ncbi:MAG: uracil-DNA glycosylase [Planctomycetota bacterium]
MDTPSHAPPPKLHPSWLAVLGDEFEKPHMASLRDFLRKEMAAHTVYPPGAKMFAALNETPFDTVRVVILGQDPYHGPGQAMGLCFSVPRGVEPPPSLQNIFAELRKDLGMPSPPHGDLTSWARQGVLLLNSVLSVRASTPGAHAAKGWELFTDRIVAELNARKEGLVFVLWGAYAAKKAAQVDGRRHLILKAPHPSPLSAYRGFIGCGHFSAINRHLEKRNETPIDWSLSV